MVTKKIVTTKVEVKLSAEQLSRLDAIRRHAGLNTRTDAVRVLIQEKFLALASLPHPRNKYGGTEYSRRTTR
jgi:metal-responsive CopG/Arc/MetJ family transcriptional regulator